jgi:uncharacterized membrane protein YeaQ/YmgE (transglycosylase-associated protein family)
MPDFSPMVQLWFNTVLIWIGFGTLAGLMAQTLLPKGKPDGLYGTLVVGMVGSCAGVYLVDLITKNVNIDEFSNINPIGPVGLVASVIISFVIILFYRLALLIKSFCTKRPTNSSNQQRQPQTQMSTSTQLPTQTPTQNSTSTSTQSTTTTPINSKEL